MLLKVRDISKSFGPKKVLQHVNFEVERGEIHGLVGKNGAGKTTLVQIIQGALDDFEGDIVFDDSNINHLRVIARQEKGIYVVPQHAAIIPEFTVGENISLGVWPKTPRGLVDFPKLYESAYKALDEYKLNLDPQAQAKNLTLVDQRKLNIVRALFSRAKLVILDEPTTSLSAAERDSLFEFIRKQSENGTSFILISHYLEEILKMCGTITVIRDGKGYTGYKRGEVNEQMLSTLIVGEDVKLFQRPAPGARDQTVTALECLEIKGNGLNGASFKLYHGEIVGLVGFPGSGARELCRSLAGLSEVISGEIKIRGNKVAHCESPESALREKIIYVSHDRHKEGIVQLLSIKENMTLSILKSKLYKRFGLLDIERETGIAQDYFSKLKVKASSVWETIGNLSGGNQQKIVMAKALCCDPDVLILDEPTVGIDVQSREEILTIIHDMTRAGLAVIYHTNDYNELLRVADRLIFFNSGRIVTEVLNTGYTAEDVIRIRDSSAGGEAS